MSREDTMTKKETPRYDYLRRIRYAIYLTPELYSRRFEYAIYLTPDAAHLRFAIYRRHRSEKQFMKSWQTKKVASDGDRTGGGSKQLFS